jgi:predicted deacylase
MSEKKPSHDENVDPPEGQSEWRVDRAASREWLRHYDPVAERAGKRVGGWLIYTDEHGAQRRIPEEEGALSSAEIAAAARATSIELGGVDRDYAKLAALERLNELRAAGTVSEENYVREKRRLQGLR